MAAFEGQNPVNQKNFGKSLLYVAFFLVVPNLIFYILSHTFFVKGVWIDIDYLILGFLLYYLPFLISYLLFVVIVSLDIIYSVLPGFHFTDANVIRSIEHVLYLDVMSISLIAGLGLIILYAVLKLLKKIASKQAALSCLLMLFVILGADTLLGKRETTDFSQKKFSSSLINNFRKNLQEESIGDEMKISGTMPAVSDVIHTHLATEKMPNHVVYIVLESIAYFNEQAANDLQWQAFSHENMANRYDIQTGIIPFKGSTVPAEMREFCRMEVETINPDLTKIDTKACLIEQFKNNDFHTLSFHGFTGLFFNRFEWYPELGFDEMFFINDIDRKIGPVRCNEGAFFEATCDESILQLIHTELLNSEHEKVFIYWLTLNTHLPVVKPMDGKLDCSLSPTTAQFEDLCHLAQQHDALFNEMVSVMTDPNLPPTLFVLVGDHAPPFLSKEILATMDNDHVPYMILWPKQDARYEEKF
ncbi:MAG: sulfatase-like hydrolase/transferase [Legionellales bacterium]